MIKMCKIDGVAPLTSSRFCDCVYAFLYKLCVQSIKPGGQQGESELLLSELCNVQVIHLLVFLAPTTLSLK